MQLQAFRFPQQKIIACSNHNLFNMQHRGVKADAGAFDFIDNPRQFRIVVSCALLNQRIPSRNCFFYFTLDLDVHRFGNKGGCIVIFC